MSIKKKRIIGLTVALVVIIFLVILGQKTFTGHKTFTVQRTTFESVISVKGEIQGKNAVYISFPDDLKHRDLRVRDFQIKDLIQEGKLVKKGDWIATLDVNNLNQQIQDNREDLERRLADFNDQKIDSAIELTRYREELKELKYDLEYRKLDLEQSQYESPAYQRKMKVAYNKTLRQIDKKRRDYELRKMDLARRTLRSEEHYNYSLHRDSLLQKALKATRVLAPQEGMVMYARTRYGRKIRVGDYVSQWNPAIASLPDLSTLISETYVEEIQITKLQPGDSVDITIDAIPEKVYKGTVAKIANMGQELSGFDSKVFHVIIELLDSDPSIKPAMTTNNNIVLKRRQGVLTIPRECLFSGNGESFVYMKKSGTIYKQPVVTGPENDREIIIESGLKEKDKVLLTRPGNFDSIELYTNAVVD